MMENGADSHFDRAWGCLPGIGMGGSLVLRMQVFR